MKGGRPVSRQIAFVAWATAAAVYLLVFLEWLFLVTRPSMFTVLSWPQRAAVLLAAALVGSVPVAAVATVIAAAWGRLAGRWRGHAGAVGLVLPAVVLSAAGFLLVENFTRTVFGFNAGSFASPLRYLYAVGWLLLTVWIHRSLAASCAAVTRQRPSAAVARLLGASAALLLAASVVAAAARHVPRVAATTAGGTAAEPPNILLLSSDGLNASHMSVYGYRRPTTPFLESRAGEFLISENHFTNSTMTTAAVAAMLTGKLPTETGVLRGGNVLQGEDVFQHLPGLLRQLGYYNVDISARVWGDAYDMNLRQGFHVSNGRSLAEEELPLLRWLGRALPSEVYFLGLTRARLGERLLHVAGIADMQDPFDLVARKETPSVRDAQRIGMLEEVIARAPRPFFAQVHLYDTHRVPNPEPGPKVPRSVFVAAEPVFSAGPAPEWEDIYDDTILAYDSFVERIVARLEAAGELDRTVLVINSDHGTRRLAHVRLPLMVRFPKAEHRGRIVANTQRIDIAPTLLSYLGVRPPDWMAGRSLLDGKLDALRPIVVTGEGAKPTDRWLSIVQCQRSYVFHVRSTRFFEHSVAGHTAPCAAGDLPGTAAARRELFKHLDVSGLLAVPFEMQLGSLKLENTVEMRQQVVRAMRSGQAASLWLGRSLAISHAHPDFWTNGTEPAAILLRNLGDQPQSHGLRVASGEGRQFPVGFVVQDGGTRREHVFTAPGSVVVDLAEVAPGSERLVLVWSDRVWLRPEGGRQLGVRILPGGTWLRDLVRGGEAEEWRAAARTVLDRRVPTVRLEDCCLAAGVHEDLWTRGAEPAGLALRNESAEPLARALVVRSGSGHDFPLRVRVHDGSGERQHVFDRPGRWVVDLPAVAPGAERLIIVRSDRGWTSAAGPGRELGVRLALDRPLAGAG